jgi:hypothetical protein
MVSTPHFAHRRYVSTNVLVQFDGSWFHVPGKKAIVTTSRNMLDFSWNFGFELSPGPKA